MSVIVSCKKCGTKKDILAYWQCVKCAAEERGVSALQSGEAPSQQLKAEIAALLTRFDCSGSERYSSWMFDKIIDKLRQLSAI